MYLSRYMHSMDIGICLGTRIHTQQSNMVIEEREGAPLHYFIVLVI